MKRVESDKNESNIREENLSKFSAGQNMEIVTKSKGSPKWPISSRAIDVTKTKHNVITSDNEIYLDKPDNMMRIPAHMEENQVKKKFFKKHQKSTIQKIIARKRKNKKTLYNHLTSKPTQAPDSDDIIDDFVPEKDDDPTTQASIKKKIKKWNNKVTKYHSQVQKMQARPFSKNKRIKRNTERDNTLILQDFDEFEFLDRKKDYDIVKTHYKKYW